MTSAPHAHKVRLRELSTGAVIERWPVDARAILEGEGYEVVSETTPTPEPEIVDPMPHVTQAAALAGQAPTGAPLAIAPASGVSPAAPVQLPAGRSSRPARG